MFKCLRPYRLSLSGLLLSINISLNLHGANLTPNPPTTIIQNFQFSSMNAQQSAELLTLLSNKNQGLDSTLRNLGTNSFNFFSSHKLLCSISILTSIYLYSLYRSVNLANSLANPENLSAWKSNCDLNQLLTIEQATLVNDLDQTIKQRYNTFFKSEIEREIAQAQQYLNFCQLIQLLHLTRLYPVNETRMKLTEQKISRLNYLKSIYHSWQRAQTAP